MASERIEARLSALEKEMAQIKRLSQGKPGPYKWAVRNFHVAGRRGGNV